MIAVTEIGQRDRLFSSPNGHDPEPEPTPRTRVDKYGWTIVDTPGKQCRLDVNSISIDPAYQREQNLGKITEIASRLSWVAFGVITVARRTDSGALFAIDGGTRLLAARRRGDIDSVPAIVFDSPDASWEASAFLRANANRKPVSSYDKYRAGLTAEDPLYVKADRMLSDAGFRVTKTSHDTPNTMNSIGTLCSLLKQHGAKFERIWPLIVEVSRGRVMQERVLVSLTRIEVALSRRDETATVGLWRARLLKLGSDGIVAATRQAAEYHKSGTSSVWAMGVVDALNRGCRIKLSLDHGSLSADQESE